MKFRNTVTLEVLNDCYIDTYDEITLVQYNKEIHDFEVIASADSLTTLLKLYEEII